MTRPTLTLAAAALLCACCKAKDTPKPDATPTPTATGPSVKQRLDRSLTLAEAIRVTLPTMRDTVNEHDEGAALLAVWLSTHVMWGEMSLLPETNYALAMKDIDAERGKRLCVSGTVLQIAKEKGADLYSGTIFTADQKSAFYIAAGSTGSIVDNSPGKFCGVVTGRFSYSNVSGGTTHAIRLVGLFDLPENRRR